MRISSRGRAYKPGPRTPTTEEYKERFMARVKVIPNGCWEWQGGTGHFGYGTFWMNRKTRRTHVVSWFLFNGYWSKMHVLHKCNYPRCVNPDHLFEGTQKDNMEWMAKSGRSCTGLKNGRHTKPWRTARGANSGFKKHPEAYPRGSERANTVVDEADVAKIRKLYAKGMSQQAIADSYGIHQTTVSKIVTGRYWKHVT